MTKDNFDIINEYNLFRKKFTGLPEFDDLNKEFEINSIEKVFIISRQIRRKINDKVIFFCKILENIIYPVLQTPLSGYESNFFSEEEKKHLIEIHKTLMVWERKSLYLDVLCGEEIEDVNYIKEVLSEWQNFKKDLINVVNKMESVWKENFKDDGEKYFG